MSWRRTIFSLKRPWRSQSSSFQTRNAPPSKHGSEVGRAHHKALSAAVGAAGVLAGLTGALIAVRINSQDAQEQNVFEGRITGALRAPSLKYADKQTMMEALREIQHQLGEEIVSTDEDDIESHSHSDLSTSNNHARPVAVLRPRNTQEVSFIARTCSRHRVPLIAFGAGSSVEGNFSTPYSGFSLDLSSEMNKIIEFHPEDMDIVVEPGVNWVQMNEEIKSSGLFLPMDPSPTAHIGGMVATNCSGTNAMRYGTMKDWVVNLTVVLADGSVVQTRRRPRKTSAGYNLNGLFTGSEGTLGIITQITLKLAVVPSHLGVATTTFTSIEDAAKAASHMMRRGIALGALELMDETQMWVINQTGGIGGKNLAEKPTLFLKFSGTECVVRESILQAEQSCSEHGGSQFKVATTEQEMDQLWQARKQALWAMMAIKPETSRLWSTDVAVPLSRLAEIMKSSKHNASKLGLFSSVLGHVGDGNFHQAVMYNPAEASETDGVRRCVDEMVDTALKMEGTVSGEHGIGLGKKDCLYKELGSATIGVMRSLKLALDPHWILNPGKVIDPS